MRTITEEEVDVAAKAFCCPDCDCVPDAYYCAKKDDRRWIRKVLEAVEAFRASRQPHGNEASDARARAHDRDSSWME